MTDATVVVHPTKQSLADAAAARLVVALVDAVQTRGVAHVSMTGGSMGSKIVSSLAAEPARAALDWGKVHVWWGDERYLPAGDPDRNDTQNDEAGLATLGLDPAHVHRVPGPDTSGSAEEAAQAYAETLRTEGGGSFDVMVLGVGPDGHIASLFPHHPAAGTTGTPAVAVHDSPKPPPDRVSLTRECLERSREVWFLVAGADKADAVRRGVEGSPFEETPGGPRPRPGAHPLARRRRRRLGPGLTGMGILDRFRRRDDADEPHEQSSPDLDDVAPLEEVATRPLTGEEDARLEAARLSYEPRGIVPADLATVAAAWDAALEREDDAEANETVTVVAAAIGDHLVGHGYRWVMSTDPFGTDLAVEPPRRGVPIVLRTLVAVRWMNRESGWLVDVVGHLADAGRR